jgi:hypothetical protein
MVSENRENRHCVSIPADWSLPKFALASRIQTTPISFGRKIKTGEIIGIEYISPESPQVQQGIRAGWSYIIKIDIEPEDPWHNIEQTLCINEAEISELQL